MRDEDDRLLAGGGLETAEVGWPGVAGEVAVRFDVPALPLAHGRFHFALSLAGSESGHVYHRLEHAAPFAVYAGGGKRGVVLLDGTWSGGEITAAAEVKTS